MKVVVYCRLNKIRMNLEPAYSIRPFAPLNIWGSSDPFALTYLLGPPWQLFGHIRITPGEHLEQNFHLIRLIIN